MPVQPVDDDRTVSTVSEREQSPDFLPWRREANTKQNFERDRLAVGLGMLQSPVTEINHVVIASLFPQYLEQVAVIVGPKGNP